MVAQGRASGAILVAMSTRKYLLILAIAVTAALLIGYIPQFLRARGLNQELEATRQILQACQARGRQAELRDTMGMAYLEANQKNYGLAARHAGRFFERAGQIRGEVSDGELGGVLDAAMRQRDEITAGLARGDAAVVEPLQRIYGDLLRTGAPALAAER